MAYTLQALIASETAIKVALPDCGYVRLPQGYAMVPVSEQRRAGSGIPFLPLIDEGLDQIPAGIVALAAAVLRAGRVVYVEASFFGGDGTQACAMWDGSGRESKRVVHPVAINLALQFLGVAVCDDYDEFDALELGRFRDTEQWSEIAEYEAGPNA